MPQLLNQEEINTLLLTAHEKSRLMISAAHTIYDTAAHFFRDKECTRKWQPHKFSRVLTGWAHSDLSEAMNDTLGLTCANYGMALEAIASGKSKHAKESIKLVISGHRDEVDKATKKGELFKEKIRDLIPQVREEIDQSVKGETLRKECFGKLDQIAETLESLEKDISRLETLHARQPGANVGQKR